jgi:Leucine-rich repeat (LRR) protein
MQVSDLTFLRGLANLNELNIGMMPVSSVEPLRGLTSLKRVSLNLTDIVDISPLLDLPALTSLSVLRTPARADVLTQLERNGVKIQR